MYKVKINLMVILEKNPRNKLCIDFIDPYKKRTKERPKLT